LNVLAGPSRLRIMAPFDCDMTNLLRYNYDIIIILWFDLVNLGSSAGRSSRLQAVPARLVCRPREGFAHCRCRWLPDLFQGPADFVPVAIHKEISMKKLLFVSLASAGVLALGACGSADDASVDAEA